MTDAPTETRKPDVLDHYRQAWAVFLREPVSWVIYATVFLAAVLFTCGLAGLLMGTYTRELGAAVREERAPRVGAAFDLSRVGNDLVNGLIWSMAISFGASFAGFGGPLAALALQFHTPLAAEDRYDPAQVVQLSAKHVLANLKDHLVFSLVSWAGTFVAISTLFVLMPVVMPVVGIAHWLFFESERDALEELARQGNYTPRESALPPPAAG